jgi:hypothetical protein
MKPEIKFGFLAILLLIIWTLVQFALQFHTVHLEYNRFSMPGIMLILFLTLLPSLREKRSDNSGHLTVRNGVRSGLIQLFITACGASVFMFLYDYRINPLWVENLVQWEYQNGGGGVFIQIANEAYATPDSVILSNTELHLCYYFLSILCIGGVFSLLISALLGDKPIQRAVPEETVRATLRHTNS